MWPSSLIDDACIAETLCRKERKTTGAWNINEQQREHADNNEVHQYGKQRTRLEQGEASPTRLELLEYEGMYGNVRI